VSTVTASALPSVAQIVFATCAIFSGVHAAVLPCDPNLAQIMMFIMKNQQ
jgi:hypothetical protein